MHSVRRIPLPASLNDTLFKWQIELSQDLQSLRSEAEKKKKSQEHWNRRDTSELKKELARTYKKCCCYCEGTVAPTGYGHIEHRLPKSKYPEKTFELDNLHYSCEVCNINKGDKTDVNVEVLDACADDIEKHITFTKPPFDMVHSLTKRGSITIKFCDLNRDELMESRQDTREKALELVQDIRDAYPQSLDAEGYKRLQKEATHGRRHCSVTRSILLRNQDIFPDIDKRNWK